ncbi:glycosyltransferase family 39 protein [Candidatus Saganbacteria bacterium]|nr:glycosyltransferase family 39 protein [Candidatus Saganbacteria bacterium]
MIKKHSFLIAMVLTLLACLYAYFQFLSPLDVFLWDESHHGLYGMQIYNDLRTSDWGMFWEHTNNQALWMPIHSWLDGIFLCLFGFSYASARASSLLLFFLSSILVFFIGRKLSKEKGWLIGLIGLSLFLSSPILLHLATVNMQEMLGIFILLLLAYFMIKFILIETAWKYLCLGALLSIAYWAKSNFALQLIFGVGLFQLSLLWGINQKPSEIEPVKQNKYVKKQPKVAIKNNLLSLVFSNDNKLIAWIVNNILIIAGFLPLFILWWAMPPFERKYGLGVLFRTQSLSDPSFSPIAGFIKAMIFYTQSLITSYTFSLWIGLGLLFSLFVSFWFFKDKKIRLISLLFWTNLLFISYISSNNIQERYLSTASPLVFLLLAYFVVLFFDYVKSLKFTSNYALVFILLLVLVASDSLSLTRYTKEVANRSIMFVIYKESLNKFSPPFLFGLAKRPAFTYPMEQGAIYSDFKTTPKSSFQDVLTFFSSNIEKNKSISTMISFAELSPYVIYWHFQGQGWLAPVFSINDLPLVKNNFWQSDYFLDIEVDSQSPYARAGDWLERRWLEIGPAMLKGKYIKLAAAKEFPDLGLTAKIYKREKF